MARVRPSATGAAIRSFTAVIQPDEADRGYVVTFPAIPDLATRGARQGEARRMAGHGRAGRARGRAVDSMPPETGLVHAPDAPGLG